MTSLLQEPQGAKRRIIIYTLLNANLQNYYAKTKYMIIRSLGPLGEQAHQTPTLNPKP